jgi:hypothetical protein
MKKAVLLVFLALLAPGCFIWLSAARADEGTDPPEFYFTRLAYSESPTGCCRHNSLGYRMPTMRIPARNYLCPEFGGSNFFPPQGWGWGTDYPGGDCKFMGGIHRLTGMRVDPNPNVIGIMDENLFNFPFVYAVEVGGMYLSDREAVRLREYLLRGGFLHADDYWGRLERQNFEAQMRKVFPDRQLELVPPTHEIFHTFFDIDTVTQVPGYGGGCYEEITWQVRDEKDPRVYGISDDTGRLMVVATYNSDLGDAWEYMDAACYPEKYSGQAYRVGLNFMIYAMTH